MPAAMLTMQVLPVSRLQLGLLGRVWLDNSAAVAVVGSRPQSEPHHRPASLDYSAPEIVPTRSDEARRDPSGTMRRANGRIAPWGLSHRAG